jgi:hypothetical protein
LLNDIALTNITLIGSEGWNPIGDDSTPFTGILNGNGYTISGLWIDRSSTSYIGLFGSIDGAQIKNLGVSINNIKGGVKGYHTVGAIAGFVNNDSSIKNSYSTGNVSGDNNVGGIAGFVYESSIANSYATGDVSGTYKVGGIAGYVDINFYDAKTSSIANSYATGDVSGSGDYVGGIAGLANYSVEVTNNAAINSAIVSDGENVSRVVGVNYSDSATISNNFALEVMEVNGVVYGGDNDLNGTSKSDEALKIKSTYETGLGWQFGENDDHPWKIDSNKNDGYPYLYWRE